MSHVAVMLRSPYLYDPEIRFEDISDADLVLLEDDPTSAERVTTFFRNSLDSISDRLTLPLGTKAPPLPPPLPLPFRREPGAPALPVDRTAPPLLSAPRPASTQWALFAGVAALVLGVLATSGSPSRAAAAAHVPAAEAKATATARTAPVEAPVAAVVAAPAAAEAEPTTLELPATPPKPKPAARAHHATAPKAKPAPAKVATISDELAEAQLRAAAR
jgi:hypothetical protein